MISIKYVYGIFISAVAILTNRVLMTQQQLITNNWPEAGTSVSYTDEVVIKVIEPLHNSVLYCEYNQLRGETSLVLQINFKQNNSILSQRLKELVIETIVDATLLSESPPVTVSIGDYMSNGGYLKGLLQGHRYLGLSLLDPTTNILLSRTLITFDVISNDSINTAMFVDITSWSSKGSVDDNKDISGHNFDRVGYFQSVYDQAYWNVGIKDGASTLSGKGSTPSTAALAMQAIQDILVMYWLCSNVILITFIFLLFRIISNGSALSIDWSMFRVGM